MGAKSKEAQKPILKRLLGMQEVAIFMILVALCLIIGFINPSFFGIANVMDLFRTASYTVICASAATFVFIMGGLDLSVGSMMGLCGMTAAILLQAGVPILLAILLGLIPGFLFGLFNGFAIVKLRIPAMIVTLSTLYMAKGLVNVITMGKPIFPLPDAFNRIGNGSFLRVPYTAYIMILVAVIASLILKYTNYGRYVYAIGGNRETARLSGIHVNLVEMAVYAVCGTFAGLSGIMITSFVGSAQVATGTGKELDIIAAVIIGGTSTFGGSGTIGGTVIGAFIMVVISNGLILARVSTFWQYVVIGIIIITTVGIDQHRRNSKKV